MPTLSTDCVKKPSAQQKSVLRLKTGRFVSVSSHRPALVLLEDIFAESADVPRTALAVVFIRQPFRGLGVVEVFIGAYAFCLLTVRTLACVVPVHNQCGCAVQTLTDSVVVTQAKWRARGNL